ncbi:metallophosphoesterase family protein [Microbacterium sp. NPDC090014]|uniref:metallophosphoesterase family protein n=1 Tax=Microbacterium sp. NPDC090014 TaxID=3364205 RepID=UPI0038169F59
MLRIAVLSDVHAYSKAELEEGGSRPSHAEISNPDNPSVNPFAAVHHLIEREKLSADVLISGGDLGDRGSAQALTYAWAEVRKLQSSLGAQLLLPATGNHDMDSRALNGYDARGALQGLKNYPFADVALNNQYWANNVVVQQHGTFRSVLLNSAAYHGYQDEWKHGRVSQRTRQHLTEALTVTPDPGINVLVTHHHLYAHGGVDLEDMSAMKESPALLNILDSGNYGSWLIIHGHRHWPSLTRASGSQGAPVVFSAGSFSAVLWDELQDKARNQFYILEIDDTNPGHRVVGTFRAWDWIIDEGFLPARERSGLPHRGGFGGTLNGAELASRIAAVYAQHGEPYLPYSTILAELPDLKYSMPSDVKQCIDVLENSHNLSVLYDREQPSQIGRSKA